MATAMVQKKVDRLEPPLAPLTDSMTAISMVEQSDPMMDSTTEPKTALKTVPKKVDRLEPTMAPMKEQMTALSTVEQSDSMKVTLTVHSMGSL